MQNLAKLFALLFLVAISYKQLLLCQMASTIITCMAEDDGQDELEDLLDLVEHESLLPAQYIYIFSSGFLGNSRSGFTYRYEQSCISAPIVELHTPPPNKA